jgi:tetratricopeptide (TPR) repeat protein
MGQGDPARTRSPADFVGRALQLEQLRRLVGDATAGSGAVAVVSGDAGIGKTRLLAEAAEQASTLGMTVRWAACWEGDGAPAYWPWIQLIRAHAADTDPIELGRDIGGDAAELARLVPDLGSTAADPGGAVDDRDGDQARFRLFDAVSSLFQRATATRPLLLMVDDLHWCDVGSVLLLRFLQRSLHESPLLVVGAVRDVEVDERSEVGRLLAEVRRDAHNLPLAGFAEGEVRELLASTIGPHEAARLAPIVRSRSGGNPLFVRELGRLLVAGDRPGLAGTSVVPDSIRAVVQRRLSRLSAGCEAMMRIAAAIGEEFGGDVLDAACEAPRRTILDHLDEAQRARLIDETDAVSLRFRFAHALVREALYEQFTLGERAETHRRVGDALERLTGDDPPFASLAHHFLRAVPVDGTARAVNYCEQAGRQAMAQLAYEDAAAHFTHAIGALGATASDDAHRAQLLLALGTARLRTGDVAAAKQAFETTAAWARRRGQPELLAEAALAFGAGFDGFEVRLFDQVQIDLLEEALEALPPEGSAIRAWIMARLSIALTYTASHERRRELAEQAVSIARRCSSEAGMAYALGAHCDVIAGPDHVNQRFAQATEIVELAERARERGLELLGRRHRLVALLELGDVAAADAEIGAFERTARTVRHPLYLAYAALWRAMRALMEARIDDCRRLTEEAAALGANAKSENFPLLADMLTHQRLADEGRFREAADAVRQEMGDVEGPWGEMTWAALIAPAEFPQEARSALDRLAGTDFSELPRDANWLGGMAAWCAQSAFALRHRDAAEKAYRLLAPYRDLFGVEGIATICHGSVARHLGALATVLGRYDEAEEHLERALAGNRRAGATVAVAHTLGAYGAMLGERGERDRAEAVLREAMTIYRGVGMAMRASQLEQMLPTHEDASPNIFRRDGEYWTLTFAGRTIRLKDAKGLRDIAALIARQGRETHVADLVADGEPDAAVGRPGAHRTRGTEVFDPVLDSRARASYRARLEALSDELEEAEAFSDLMRAERARTEMDMVAGELASALGLGGRPRQSANPSERARKAVARRIRTALGRIQTDHRELARHLDHSLRLGRFCSYNPELPTSWLL